MQEIAFNGVKLKTMNKTHRFQIWINHADRNRYVTPQSMHASAIEVSEKITADHKVRVVHDPMQYSKSYF